MVYKEEIRDLFTVSDDYYLAHCISVDFALGAGIAREFNKKFDMRRKLKERCFNLSDYMVRCNLDGTCVLIDHVLNLVTKQKYFHKPTYDSLQQALYAARQICIRNNIKKIAMPQIGCGLDRLSWTEVSRIIQQVFGDMEIEILVCKL